MCDVIAAIDTHQPVAASASESAATMSMPVSGSISGPS